MFKKLLIASVAVIAGLVVLTRMTKITPAVWFGDCCRSAQSWVPPEKRLAQLKVDIDNIDKDIDKNLITLARMATEVEQFSENLDGNRTRQAHLRADIKDLEKCLENDAQKVVFRGRSCDADDLTRRLELYTTEFLCLKEKVKVQEKIYAEKKRTLVAAKDRITAMKNEQERLRVLALRLDSELELVRMSQIKNQVSDFDDSALSRAQQNAKAVETSLKEIKHRIDYMREFGRTDSTTLETIKGKSREEVLHSAKAALRDDNATEEVLLDKVNDNK